MPEQAIEIIYNRERKRRVVIYRRDSGTYGCREEWFHKDEAAEGWAQLWGRASVYADLETAKREAVENVPWLMEILTGK
jgi:hypothetical protein